jgi:hypothetical protein
VQFGPPCPILAALQSPAILVLGGIQKGYLRLTILPSRILAMLLCVRGKLTRHKSRFTQNGQETTTSVNDSRCRRHPSSFFVLSWTSTVSCALLSPDVITQIAGLKAVRECAEKAPIHFETFARSISDFATSHVYLGTQGLKAS